MNIGILGLGLIGGSLAQALRAKTAHTLSGFDRDPETLRAAQTTGVLDAVLPLDRKMDCDVLILAVPPGATLSFLKDHAGHIAPGTRVVDCCGVKQTICALGFEQARRQGFHFIGGHPMAGRECSGFQSSKADLFRNASMILVPAEETPSEIRDEIGRLFLCLGFREIRWSTPREHDERIALTSQLAHVVSNAYVKSPQALLHNGFSAGSFADLTRVARLDEHLWTELFMENRDCLLKEIDGLMNAIAAYRTALEKRDVEGLKALLKQGRECKEHIG